MKLCVLILALCACGSPSGDGAISPSSATAEDLYGWWRAEDFTVRVLGFESEQNARKTMPIVNDLHDGPAMATHIGETYLWTSTSNYEVSEGQLLTTIQSGAQGGSGMSFTQEIVSITPKESLTLKVQDPNGGGLISRTYSYMEYCPTEKPHGWQESARFACDATPNSTGTSVAVEDDGTVHVMSSRGQDFGGDPSCLQRHWYAVMGRGCRPSHYGIPPITASAMGISNNTLHALVVVDGELEYWHRDLDEPYFATEGAFAEPDGQLYLGIGESGIARYAFIQLGVLNVGEIVDGVTSSRVARQIPSGEVYMTNILDAAVSPDGRLAILQTNGTLMVEDEALSANFSDVMLSKQPMSGAGGAVAWDEDNRIHVVWSHTAITNSDTGVGGAVASGRASYAVYAGTTLSETPLFENEIGLMMYPLMTKAGTVLHMLRKGRGARMFLSTINPENGDLVAIEVVRVDQPPGTSSPQAYAQGAMAIGADGTIAIAYDGSNVHHRRPTTTRANVVLSFEMTNKGSIEDLDGYLDCADMNCTIEVPAGTVLRVRSPDGQPIRIAGCLPYEFNEIGYCMIPVVGPAQY